MNHHHRDLRRVARSAECRLPGIAATTPEAIRTLVRRARNAGVIVFLKDELERLPWQVQEIIEREHRRLGEGRNGNG